MITDMNVESRPYRSPVRQAQAEATRVQIMEAVARRMEAGDEELSFASVASAAGIQERTVYRHFANKDALLGGFWRWVNERYPGGGTPRTEEELKRGPVEVFRDFDKRAALVRAMLSTPQGREVRLRDLEARQAAYREALSGVTEGMDDPAERRLCAVVQLLYSASAWQSMRDYWGLEGDEAGQACAWALTTLIESLKEDKK